MNLKQLRDAILFKNQDMRNTLMPSVLGRLNSYLSDNSLVSVETSALEFYLLNQAFGELSIRINEKAPLTPDQEKLATLYLNKASASSARLFYYILVIITREARHVKESKTLEESINAKYGKALGAFFKGLRDQSPEGVLSKLKGGSSQLNNLSNVTFGNYVSAILTIFKDGNFSKGFGGLPWWNIANTLNKTISGEISLELMNDTAWTLAHNNGPIFNKGVLYNSYTSLIYKILDVQRAGMLPQYVASGECPHSNVAVKSAVSLISKVLPDTVVGSVDWVKVKQLGALHMGKASKDKKDKKDKKDATPNWSNPTSLLDALKPKSSKDIGSIYPSEDVMWITDTDYVIKTYKARAY